MKNKAQIKIQQMAFMLMAVFLFFILAGLFWLVVQGQSWKKEAALLERNNAVELAGMLAGSGEFSCGSYCVDMDKAMALRNRTAYKGFWKAGIEIRKLDSGKEKECTNSNYPDCNLIKINEEKKSGSMSSFVSLCYRIKEKGYVELKCKLGRFIVRYDVKI